MGVTGDMAGRCVWGGERMCLWEEWWGVCWRRKGKVVKNEGALGAGKLGVGGWGCAGSGRRRGRE